jgi:mutator protein MutT
LSADKHTRGVTHVVAAAVIDGNERVLIAQRPLGKHLAGGWEFPGGKLEPGETRREGLARELLEEIGITIREPRPLIRVRHTYPYGEVLLDIWVVRRYSGEPQGLDGQQLRWCTEGELATADLLPADRPIVAALRLPERLMQISSRDYTIRSPSVRLLRDIIDTNSTGATEDTKLHGVCCSGCEEAVAAARAGADFLVMRDALADGEFAALCESVAVPVYARGIGLEDAWALGASGVNETDA